MSKRDLENDLRELASQAADDAFADELYCALCNTDWVHDDGTEWGVTWRHAGEIVADLRHKSECYLDFYCSSSGAEGTISARVGAALGELGWHGSPMT